VGAFNIDRLSISKIIVIFVESHPMGGARLSGGQGDALGDRSASTLLGEFSFRVLDMPLPMTKAYTVKFDGGGRLRSAQVDISNWLILWAKLDVVGRDDPIKP